MMSSNASDRWIRPVIITVVGLAFLIFGVFCFVRQDPSGTNPVEIVLIGRDVAFWLEEKPDERNPSLQLNRGRPVKLVIRNEEPGKVLHCFTIGGLDVKTSHDLETGESEILNFTPAETGTFSYACMMHPMMTGTVIVN